MADCFKVGDLVWAKLKGFSYWPGKVIRPNVEVKRPSKKGPHQFVFFFSSDNYAWVPEDSVVPYLRLREKYRTATRLSRALKDAVGIIEAAWQASNQDDSNLPSIDDELSEMRASADRGTSLVREPSARKESTVELKSTTKRKSAGVSRNAKSAKRTASTNSSDFTHIVPRKNAGQAERPTPTSASSSSRKSAPTKRASILTADRLSHKAPKFFTSRSVSSVLLDDLGAVSCVDDIARHKDESTKARLSPDHNKTLEFPGNDDGASKETAAGDLLHTIPSKTVIPTPLRIGFLGLGIMGQGMVMNVLRSGHEVTVWNRTIAKTREFVKAGAFRGINPADVVKSCDITFTCVSDSVAVRDVVFGNQGVLDGMAPGKCYVEMSTVDEETVQDVADAVMERGGTFLEAPVCGSRVPALEGQLTVLTSGDRKLYDDCYSCFEAIGKKSFYLGNEVGTATRMKLVHNMVLGSLVASLAECMSLAEKVGLDQDDLHEILCLGPLNCSTVNHKSQAIINGKFDPHFPLLHQQKDLRLVLSMGDSVEQPLYVAAAANELYKKARNLGFGDGDVSAVFKATSS